MSLAIYGALRTAFSGMHQSGEMTMSDAVLFSLVDAIRVCVCELAGRLVLLRIQKWEDRLQFPGGQRRDWKRAKMFVFTIANTFGAIIIMVGYRAFAQGLCRLGFRASGFTDHPLSVSSINDDDEHPFTGARWAIEAPACYDLNCVGDIELHLWLMVCTRHIGFPLARFITALVR